MTSFHSVGVIASDIIRRETTNGVLATFRLATGQFGHGRLWIDVEAWGNTAGVLNAHGSTGRGIAIAGRLTHKSWRDRQTGEQRERLVATATDFDFLDPSLDAAEIDVANHVLGTGKLESAPTIDRAGSKARVTFTIASGQAGTKTGRLWLPVDAWGRTADTATDLRKGQVVAFGGRLSYRFRADENGEKVGGYSLSAYSLASLAPRSGASDETAAGSAGHAVKVFS